MNTTSNFVTTDGETPENAVLPNTGSMTPALLGRSKPSLLSGRELEIVGWVAKGNSNVAIASKLGISPFTVNTYISRILLKTNCADRTSAVVYCIRHQLIDC